MSVVPPRLVIQREELWDPGVVSGLVIMAMHTVGRYTRPAGLCELF